MPHLTSPSLFKKMFLFLIIPIAIIMAGGFWYYPHLARLSSVVRQLVDSEDDLESWRRRGNCNKSNNEEGLCLAQNNAGRIFLSRNMV